MEGAGLTDKPGICFHALRHKDAEPTERVTAPDQKDFREKFPAKYRATDGHLVRSRAEMLIDNWLYMSGIVHAVERKLPIEEDVRSSEATMSLVTRRETRGPLRR